MITEKNFNLMCTEVLEILKYCPKSDVEKIPTKFIELLEKNKIENLKVTIDPNKDIFSQEVCEETIIAMFIIYRDYWATQEEKNEIDKILKENQIKLAEKFNYENLFKNKEDKCKIEQGKKERNSVAMIEYNENFIKKIINIIKKIFKKQK